MKKLLLCFSVIFCLIVIIACNEHSQAVHGEFSLINFGADWYAETYYLVIPIHWSGKSPATIDAIRLIKKGGQPITYEEDSINYTFFGADRFKKSGIYNESDVGDLKKLKDVAIEGDGKITLKLALGEKVQKDSERRLKISFSVNGKENEQIVEWNTLEQVTTISQNNSMIPYTN